MRLGPPPEADEEILFGVYAALFAEHGHPLGRDDYFTHLAGLSEHEIVRAWLGDRDDLESIVRWEDYSRAKDEMFAYTDIKQAPWYVVNAENKKKARLNVIQHLLQLISYEDLTPKPLKLPPLDKSKYVRPPMQDQTFVPEKYC